MQSHKMFPLTAPHSARLPHRRPLALAAALAAFSALAAPAAALAAAGDGPRIAPASAPAGSSAEGATATLPAVRVTATSTGDAPTADGNYNARRSSTALGLDLSRRDTPQSLSVVTRQLMDDFGLRSANEVLDLVTGVNVERVETDRTYYTARGFDVTNFQFDGVGMPFTNGSQWGDLDTALYERIDVLRGANGLLSATGNPSATVNFVTKRPTDTFQASAALTLGSWRQRRAEADVSGRLNAAGTVRGRLVAAKDTSDSYLARYGVDKTAVLGALDVDLSPTTLLSLSFADQRKDADSPMWGALPLHHSDGSPTSYDVSTSTATDWAYWNNHEQRLQASLTQELAGDWTLKATAQRRTHRADSELFYVYGNPDASTGTGLMAYPSAFKGDYTQQLADVRVSGPFSLAGRRHQAMAGFSVAHEQARERSDYGTGIGDAVPDLRTWDGRWAKPAFTNGTGGSSFSTTRQSAYAATQLQLSEPLKLIVGANATHIRSAGENYGVAHAYDRGMVTPYLGGVYTLSPQATLYASHTGIFNPQTQVDVNQRVLDPIRGRSLEAGLKTEWLARQLAANLAVFRTRQANTAEQAGTFANYQAYYRGVDATATGYELELTGKLTPSWNLQAGLTQFKLVDDAGEDARTFVPRRTVRMATTYEARADLKLGAALRHQSHISTMNGSTEIQQGGYTLLDLSAQYAWSKQLSVAVKLNNVTDKKYLTSLYWTQAYHGAPRNGSVQLRWTY